MFQAKQYVFRLALLTAAIATAAPADARIRCNGAYQIVAGEEIATPYCQDEYLARVARGYGIRVSGRTIRYNPNRKEEVCRAIGHDPRIYDICLKYRNNGCSGFNC